MAENSKIKWRKVPHHPKWIGRMDGKHVASILMSPQVRVWYFVDDSVGEVWFANVPEDIKSLKRAVETFLLRESEAIR